MRKDFKNYDSHIKSTITQIFEYHLMYTYYNICIVLLQSLNRRYKRNTSKRIYGVGKYKSLIIKIINAACDICCGKK
ncbi:hypothetical protein V1477_007308 [Vespula maculifrons]|uniref:Uncharacterized protein n=1 Tax=Vespula maculifrons TaxID=7453 RepID=A0ABD2CIC8_VESMC